MVTPIAERVFGLYYFLPGGDRESDREHFLAALHEYAMGRVCPAMPDGRGAMLVIRSSCFNLADLVGAAESWILPARGDSILVCEIGEVTGLGDAAMSALGFLGADVPQPAKVQELEWIDPPTGKRCKSIRVNCTPLAVAVGLQVATKLLRSAACKARPVARMDG